MSNLEPPSSPSAVSPTRGSKRHQIKRSLSEFTSPTKAARNAPPQPSPSQRERLQQSHQAYQQQLQQLQSPNSVQRTQNASESRTGQPYSATRTRHSLDIPRRDKAAMMTSPSESRRPSITIPREVVPARDAGENTHSAPKELLSRETVPLQRQVSAPQSAEPLSKSLAQLNTFSTQASQRLDEAYYAVLEKMSTLQSTVMALKDVAESSNEVCETFDKDTRSMENEIASQLGSLGHFQAQQSKISSLQSRIENGRREIDGLNTRVDSVRERVEQWERADKQWQEKTRKRLKIIWSVGSVVTLTLLVILWVFGDSGSDTVKSGVVEPAIRIHEPLNKSHFAVPPTDDERLDGKVVWKAAEDDGNDRLRAFDEL